MTLVPSSGFRNAVLLQGPNGPFFKRFGDDLRKRGVEVTKVNFQPGDWLFYRGPNTVTYRGPLDDWKAFFRKLVQERGFDAVFAFGDGRPLHRDAIAVARELGIQIWVFEEGYLRPDYITLERDGVNGNSRLPKEAEFYRSEAPKVTPSDRVAVGRTFNAQAWWTTLHALALTLFGWLFPSYRHHRNVNAWLQAAYWVRGWFRKHLYAWRERHVLPYLVREQPRQFFLVPLQVHLDSQMQHADYADFREFIEEVVAGFARNAPPGTLLVLKHHPHDRAYRDYTGYLAELERRYGCVGRLVYIHDQHLPTLLKNTRGVITMNSTVGLQALAHGAPVKAMGRAIYNFEGLTSAKSLAKFFQEPGGVDRDLHRDFVAYLRATNQINGSFYRFVSGCPSVAAFALGVADSPECIDEAAGESAG